MDHKVTQLLQNNNGLIQASDARLLGVDNKVLQRLTTKGKLERIGHGLYLDAEYMEDEYLIAQYRCSKGIFSHETALYFHNLSDRTPLYLTMTIPSKYNSRLIKEKNSFQFFYCKQELHQIGQISITSPFGNTIRVYNKERTICDCIRKKAKLDSDLVLTAFKQYMKEGGNDYARLLKYAEIFKIRDTIKQYMEVLN